MGQTVLEKQWCAKILPDDGWYTIHNKQQTWFVWLRHKSTTHEWLALMSWDFESGWAGSAKRSEDDTFET